MAESIQEAHTVGRWGNAGAPLLAKVYRWKLLPESYLYGLADLAMWSGSAYPSVILGELHPKGSWYYFPVVFLIKSTLGFLLLLFLAPAAKRLRDKQVRRAFFFVTIPPVMYFAISLTFRLNIGVRHILPVYPFLTVLAAAGCWGLLKQGRRWVYVVAPLLGFHALSSLRSFPDYLAYSNEAWGGPARTYRVLTDSNVDWGQGLIAAKRYLDRRHISDCWIAYFGAVDPAYYHIPCRPLHGTPASRPPDQIPQVLQGTVLIGATTLRLSGPPELNPYADFLRAKPAHVIAGCILVFEGKFDFRLGSALAHLENARRQAWGRKPVQAVAEARLAVLLAPNSAEAHEALGDLLLQLGLADEARVQYQTALSLAEAIRPEFQQHRILSLQRKLAQGRNRATAVTPVPARPPCTGRLNSTVASRDPSPG